jgi:hypothetical protein
MSFGSLPFVDKRLAHASLGAREHRTVQLIVELMTEPSP